MPAPVRLPEAICTFTSVMVSGRFVDLRASVTGPEVQTLRRLEQQQERAAATAQSKGGLPTPLDQQVEATTDAYAFPRIFTSSGQEVQFVDSGGVETTIAAVEVVALLAFATRRINGNGLAFAREERQ
jgi:hypothetical protein